MVFAGAAGVYVPVKRVLEGDEALYSLSEAEAAAVGGRWEDEYSCDVC